MPFFFWLPWGKKTSEFLISSGCLLNFVEKYNGLSESVHQNRRKGGLHESEIWVFSNTKMSNKNRLEKVHKKNSVICLVFMFPS